MSSLTSGIKIDRSKVSGLSGLSELSPALSSSEPLGNYNLAHDVYVVIAIINSGIVDDSEAVSKFRLWCLSLPVVNHIMSSYSDFPPTHIMTVWNYVDRVHSSKSNSSKFRIFSHALWYLRCCCSYHVQTEVLNWIASWTLD